MARVDTALHGDPRKPLVLYPVVVDRMQHALQCQCSCGQMLETADQQAVFAFKRGHDVAASCNKCSRPILMRHRLILTAGGT